MPDESMLARKFELAEESFWAFLKFFAKSIDEQDPDTREPKDYPTGMVTKQLPNGDRLERNFWVEKPMARLMETLEGSPEADEPKVLYIIKSRRMRCTLRASNYAAYLLLFGENENMAVFSSDKDRAWRQNIRYAWTSLSLFPWAEARKVSKHWEAEIRPPYPINGANYLHAKRIKKEMLITVTGYKSEGGEKLFTNEFRALNSPRGDPLTWAFVDEAKDIDNFMNLLDAQIRKTHAWYRPILVQGTVEGRNEFDMAAFNELDDCPEDLKVNPDVQGAAFDAPEDVPEVCERGVKSWKNYKGDQVVFLTCKADPWKRPGTEWWKHKIELGGDRARQEFLCDRDVVVDEKRVYPDFQPERHTYSIDEDRHTEFAEIVKHSPLIFSWDEAQTRKGCTIGQLVGNVLVMHRSWRGEDMHWEDFVQKVVLEANQEIPAGIPVIDTGDIQLWSRNSGARAGQDWTPIRIVEKVRKSYGNRQQYTFHIQRRKILDHYTEWIKQRLTRSRTVSRENPQGVPLLLLNGEDESLQLAIKNAVWNIPEGRFEPRSSRPIKDYYHKDILDCIHYTECCIRQFWYFQDVQGGSNMNDFWEANDIGGVPEQVDSGREVDFGAWNNA